MRKFQLVGLMALVIIGFSFSSCSKYEDGPSISLRSKTARLAQTWVIDKVSVNDVALTADEIAMDEGRNVEMTLAKDGTLTITSVDDSAKIVTQTGTWKLQNSDKEIVIVVDGASDSDTILKMTNSELWFWHMDGTDKMEMHWKVK